MPNWTTNTVIFSVNDKKEKSKIKLIKESVSSKESVFDFEQIIPHPKVLSLVEKENDSKDGLNSEVSQRHPNRQWYDFQSSVWGTKWNAVDPSITYDGATKLSYEFNTAWDAPRGIVDYLKFLFRDVDILWEAVHEDGNEEETILEHKSDKRSRLNFMLDKVSPRLN
tara:strand:- start:47 stop:547 length:501 start_codon:yes stop_codon:yes gene_type:complete